MGLGLGLVLGLGLGLSWGLIVRGYLDLCLVAEDLVEPVDVCDVDGLALEMADAEEAGEEEGGEEPEGEAGERGIDDDRDGTAAEAGELDAVQLLEPDGLACGECLHVGIVLVQRDEGRSRSRLRG